MKRVILALALAGGLAALASPCLAASATPHGQGHHAARRRQGAQTAGRDGTPVRSLQAFARALRRPLHSADDQPLFDAAYAAMDAAQHRGGLYVSVPPGLYRVAHVAIGANGGYFCAGAPQACTLQAVRAPAETAETCLVELTDPYATNWLFTGFILKGGWTYGRAPYAAAPETDPWLDHQHGACFNNALNGAADARYYANSKIASQNPRGRASELLISGFGGDGFRIAGSGANVIGPVAVFNVGGHGFFIDQYDSKFNDLDAGQVGRSGLWLGPSGSGDFIDGKVWFAGGRRRPGDDQGLHIDGGGGNTLNIDVQDTAGDALYLDHSGLNRIMARAGWQGVVGPVDAPASLITLRGSAYNSLAVTGYVDQSRQAFAGVTRLVSDLQGPGGFSNHNQILITHRGWPGDQGLWNPAWVFGPLDMSNQLIANNVTRTPQVWRGDTYGHANFGVGANGGAAGLTAFDDSTSSPGAVAIYGSGGDVYITGQTKGVFAPRPGLGVDANGNLKLPNLPLYANDAAAAAGGAPKYAAYRDPQGLVHVCLSC